MTQNGRTRCSSRSSGSCRLNLISVGQFHEDSLKKDEDAIVQVWAGICTFTPSLGFTPFGDNFTSRLLVSTGAPSLCKPLEAAFLALELALQLPGGTSGGSSSSRLYSCKELHCQDGLHLEFGISKLADRIKNPMKSVLFLESQGQPLWGEKMKTRVLTRTSVVPSNFSSSMG